MRYQKKANRNKNSRSKKFLEEKETYFPNGNIKNLKMANLERFLLRKCVEDISFLTRRCASIQLNGWGSGDMKHVFEEIKDAEEKELREEEGEV